MVSKKKAVKVSLFSALAVGVIHFIAHQLTTDYRVVGVIVFASVYLIGYFGMIKGKIK